MTQEDFRGYLIGRRRIDRGPTVLLSLVVVWLAIPSRQLVAQSAPEVVLHARGGAVLNAILLSVDDDGILVDRFCGDWDSNRIPALDGVLYFQWRQVDSVVLHAATAVTPFLLALIKGFLWMIPSVLVGGAVGVEVCGQSRDDRDCVSSVATVAGSIGFLVGTIFNWPDADLNGDRAFHPSNHDERAELRVLCVYPDELPVELREKLGPHE